ncbi:unnamed protein product [Amoebophrya sp. A120]|nr:unnamed protein product [Amoebophrya sp. A120]|eukprot:GSA120T00021703001.1
MARSTSASMDLLRARKRLFLVEHWFEALTDVTEDLEQLFAALFYDADGTLFCSLAACMETVLFGVRPPRTQAEADTKSRDILQVRALLEVLPGVLCRADAVAIASQSPTSPSEDDPGQATKNTYLYRRSQSPLLVRIAALARREVRLYTSSSPADLFHPTTSLCFRFLRGVVASSQALFPEVLLRAAVERSFAARSAISAKGGNGDAASNIAALLDAVTNAVALNSASTCSPVAQAIFEVICETVRHESTMLSPGDVCVRLYGQLLGERVRSLYKLRAIDAMALVHTGQDGSALDNSKGPPAGSPDDGTLEDTEKDGVQIIAAFFDRLCLPRFPESEGEARADRQKVTLALDIAVQLNPVLRRCEDLFYDWFRKTCSRSTSVCHVNSLADVTAAVAAGAKGYGGAMISDGRHDSSLQERLHRSYLIPEIVRVADNDLMTLFFDKKTRKGESSPSTPAPVPAAALEQENASALEGRIETAGIALAFQELEKSTLAQMQAFMVSRRMELVTHIVAGTGGCDALVYPDSPLSPVLSEDKAAKLPVVPKLFSCFRSVFVRQLNSIAKFNLRRFRELQNKRGHWQPSPTGNPEEFVAPADCLAAPAEIMRQQRGSSSTTAPLDSTSRDRDEEELPFIVHEYQAVDLGNVLAPMSPEFLAQVVALLSDPYQRSCWDLNMVDFRILEAIPADSSTNLVHHICYAAWDPPQHCQPHLVGGGTRDAALCVSCGFVATEVEDQTSKAKNFFATSFSVSRPDVPAVPGRLRMQVDADDFLISPQTGSIAHIRRADARGKWRDERNKVLWYALGARGDRMPVQEVVDASVTEFDA